MNGNRKKKAQQSISSRRNPKFLPKESVEDIYPFEVANLQKISIQKKNYINQLQRQYLQRYNAMVNNRLIYSQLLQNIASELDSKGIDIKNLLQLCQIVKIKDPTELQDI